jgi:uncharacterized membrane protein
MVFDAAGVAVIALGLTVALVRFGIGWRSVADPYRRLRHELGKGILLGLEFLVAADIIRTVTLAPTIENVLVLGLIVLIRTFLSLALQVELEGQWPWQRAARSAER